MEPVRLDVYPDYTEYVKIPMDVGTAWQKCEAGCYSHESELAADLCLIMENCHRYCDSRFPELPQLCDEVCSIVDMFVRACELGMCDVGGNSQAVFSPYMLPALLN